MSYGHAAAVHAALKRLYPDADAAREATVRIMEEQARKAREDAPDEAGQDDDT